MKKFYELYNKFQWLEIEGDYIIDVNCSCKDFTYRRMKKVDSKDPTSKVVVKSLCKHLIKLIRRYYSEKKIKLGGNEMEEIQPVPMEDSEEPEKSEKPEEPEEPEESEESKE